MTQLDRRAFCAAAGVALAGLIASPVARAEKTATVRGAADRYPDIIGTTLRYRTVHEDTFVDLARTFGLGYTELRAANPGVDPWVPGTGMEIVLPSAHILPNAPRKGLVLNLADQRIYFFRPDGVTVDTAPVGIGDDGWHTPRGSTTVVRKKHLPTWFVPESVREQQPDLPAAVPPGPDNPLGEHAIYLGWPSYLLHGTNKPYGVGRRVSHGCVRLYPEDIRRLFPDIAIGTPVTVVDQPVKLARTENQLWLEVHPSQGQADEIEELGTFTPTRPAEFEYQVMAAAGPDRDRIDWPAAQQIARERLGVPAPILRPKETASSIP